MAKGMGNGFPVGGVLISPAIRPWHGMLGTTFGGSHLACAAAIAVLEVMKEENLIENAASVGEYLSGLLKTLGSDIAIRGPGLMIGMEFPYPVKEIREHLLNKHHIFTGFSGANTLRLLPPLCLNREQAYRFFQAIRSEILINQNKK
jgi:acetylornithine aminotransferase